MHEDFKDFDLRLRSMLQDAEMKPSRRVWKGISRQLDAAGAEARNAQVLGAGSVFGTSGRTAWYGWAGAGFAFAAVVALVLVLTGTRKQFDHQYTPQALQAQSSEIMLLPIEESRTLLAEFRRVKLSGDAAPAIDGSCSELSNQESVAQSRSESAPEADIKSFLKKYRTFDSDPFAEMEDEQPRTKGRTAIYAKGLIGANEAGLQAFRGLSSLAPGVTETGIVELGESSFGIPLTLGLGVRFYLAPRLSLGTGVDVSLLSRSFTGKFSGEGANITHSMIYLGVPANLYFDVFESDRLKFYVYGGGEIEYCVSNKYTIHSTPENVQTSKVTKPMVSLGAGLGLEFGLSRSLGLYIDPGLRYYFPSDQPRSVRTEKSFTVSLDAGLRFNF